MVAKMALNGEDNQRMRLSISNTEDGLTIDGDLITDDPMVSFDPESTAESLGGYSLCDIFSESMIKDCVVQIEKVKHMWRVIGFEAEITERKIESLRRSLMDSVDHFVGREKSLYDSYRKQIKICQNKIETILGDMAIYMPESELAALMNQANTLAGGSLLEQLSLYKHIEQNLTTRRDEYLREVNTCKDQLKNVLKSLTLKPEKSYIELMGQKVITTQQLEQLKKLTEEKIAELGERMNSCGRLASRIVYLSQTIPDDLDCEFRLEESENPLPEGTIYNDNLFVTLTEQYEQKMSRLDRAWQILLDLWTKLDKLYKLFSIVEPEKKHRYFDRIEILLGSEKEKIFAETWLKETSLQDIVEQFECELDYYEKMKAEKLQELINNMRRQYLNLLELCLSREEYLVEDERFWFLLTEDYNEQLLATFETEFEILNQYYRKYEELILAFNQWRELSVKVEDCGQELHEIMNHRNRGGILQQTLKRQTVLKKRLSITEKQIDSYLQTQWAELTEITDLLPFHLYHVEAEDLVHELKHSTVCSEYKQRFSVASNTTYHSMGE